MVSINPTRQGGGLGAIPFKPLEFLMFNGEYRINPSRQGGGLGAIPFKSLEFLIFNVEY
jgi:hypothetical protein